MNPLVRMCSNVPELRFREKRKMNVRQKDNKYERHLEARVRAQAALQGVGLYEYRNRSKSDFLLPKPANDGRKSICAGGVFQSDSYFLRNVPSPLSIVRVIDQGLPEQTKGEVIMTEAVISEEKLILDQPDTVTSAGKVEQVVVGKKSKKAAIKLQESEEGEKLICDAPNGDVEILQ